MSGLVGQIGSRSGLIGTTELEYEEGVWTATLASGAGSTPTNANGHYTKIGRLVHVVFSSSISASYNGTAVQVSGLPFTCSQLGLCPAGGTARIQHVTGHYWVVDDSSTTLNLKKMDANSGGAGTVNSQSGTYGPPYQINMIYMTS
tara:strand:- start:314 stop:751 length:438 start_codon:yes stop_codon:yes gene_type:complete